MNQEELSGEDIHRLIELLERRLEIIGDAELRESDPEKQMRELQSASEAIFEAQKRLGAKFPPRLKHFFDGCSYDKALSFLKTIGN